MKKTAIIFGTDSGTTRLIAKKMARILGSEIVDKPININRIDLDDFMSYDVLILGTPTYGDGVLPGKSTGITAGSWEEFLPQLQGKDLSDKTIALYGLGDQEKYPERFASALIQLYSVLNDNGAKFVGKWSTEGYKFEHSDAIIEDKFVGLIVDHGYQGMLTDERIKAWLSQLKSELDLL